MSSRNKEEMAQELAELTDATRRLCKLHGALGLEYPKTAAFTTLPAPPLMKQAQTSRPPLPAPSPPPQTKKTSAAVFPSQDIADLKDTINHCERCPAEVKRPTPLFGKGRQERPTLLIIGNAANREDVARERIFSEQEGDLLGKMLAAINISEEDVFQTNIIRCALDNAEVAMETQLKNCRSHLMEQINLFRPLIICTMGQMASQSLLATKNKIIALRGRFHQFNGIPLMATYHPGQLLLVPDLKKAAWYDLQLIQHKIKQFQKG